jgi:hypothetical protein
VKHVLEAPERVDERLTQGQDGWLELHDRSWQIREAHDQAQGEQRLDGAETKDGDPSQKRDEHPGSLPSRWPARLPTCKTSATRSTPQPLLPPPVSHQADERPG